LSGYCDFDIVTKDTLMSCLVGEKIRKEKIKHGKQCIGFRVLFSLFSFSLLRSTLLEREREKKKEKLRER
jgi:hypothetical protein